MRHRLSMTPSGATRPPASMSCGCRGLVSRPGPPSGSECYTSGWKCQHRWTQIASMVQFRNAVAGTSVVNWWDNGGDAIAKIPPAES